MNESVRETEILNESELHPVSGVSPESLRGQYRLPDDVRELLQTGCFARYLHPAGVPVDPNPQLHAGKDDCRSIKILSNITTRATAAEPPGCTHTLGLGDL